MNNKNGDEGHGRRDPGTRETSVLPFPAVYKLLNMPPTRCVSRHGTLHQRRSIFGSGCLLRLPQTPPYRPPPRPSKSYDVMSGTLYAGSPHGSSAVSLLCRKTLQVTLLPKTKTEGTHHWVISTILEKRFPPFGRAPLCIEALECFAKTK